MPRCYVFAWLGGALLRYTLQRAGWRLPCHLTPRAEYGLWRLRLL